MTREEFKKIVFEASKNDTSSPKNCIHLLSLHAYIENLFSDFDAKKTSFDAHASDLRCVIDRYMEEASMYKNAWERAMAEHETQLKAKDEEIERLKAILASTVSKSIVGGFKIGEQKARSIVAMLFWEWKKQCINCDKYDDHTFAREQKRSEACYCFKKAYAMLKDNQCKN